MNERKDKAKEIGGFEKQSESAPQKLLVIKNRRFLSDRAEILTQRSARYVAGLRPALPSLRGPFISKHPTKTLCQKKSAGRSFPACVTVM